MVNALVLKQQIDYWEKITQEYQKAKRTKPGSGSNRVPVEHFEVIAGSETALLSEAAMVYHTDAKGLLITALAAGLRKQHNLNTIFIGIFEENRDIGDSTLDLSRTVGRKACTRYRYCLQMQHPPMS